MSNWKIFKGTLIPHNGIDCLPSPPPWRQLPGEQKEPRGSNFRMSPEIIDTVNAALHLRRPILVTGNPGTGKSTLIYAVAHELQLGPVFTWAVTSRSTLSEAQYRYDALQRLNDQEFIRGTPPGQEKLDIANYFRLGPLGSALAPAQRPRALLIDEIDKSDVDLANDLLNVLEEGTFEIPELARIKESQSEVKVRLHQSNEIAHIVNGKVQCTQFPFTIITSNREREFPPPFLRRCLRVTMPDPDEPLLCEIVRAHLGSAVDTVAAELVKRFCERPVGTVATDQLLNAVFLVSGREKLSEKERKRVIDLVFREIAPASDSGGDVE